MATSWGIENVLKEVDDLESLQKLRPNALAFPMLLETMEHEIKAIDALTPPCWLKMTENSLQNALDEKEINASAGALKVQNNQQMPQKNCHFDSKLEQFRIFCLLF